MQFYNYGAIEHRPSTQIVVSLYGEGHVVHTICWPALLDTGSPFAVILPGECSSAVSWGNESVVVRVHSAHGANSEVILPVGDRPAVFGGVGARQETHLGFKADVNIPGFDLFPYITVYFHSAIRHAVIGTPVLLHQMASRTTPHNGTCFRAGAFRGGPCWFARAVLFLQGRRF